MGEEEKDPEYYADLARDEGIGALNDWETAVRREIELQEDRISTFVENAEKKIGAAYSDADTPQNWKSDLLEWIEAAIPGESPGLYLDGGPAEKYASDVLPHLLLVDEDRREEWIDRWGLVRRCRSLIQMLNARLRAIRSAREILLFNHELIGAEGLPDIFEGRPTLRDHAAEIVGKYRSDPGSLPEGRSAMGDFKEKWVPDSPESTGYSKVQMIQRAIREAGLSEEYSDPESFCDLVERLVERHDTAQP